MSPELTETAWWLLGRIGLVIGLLYLGIVAIAFCDWLFGFEDEW